jgi:hypothetical protein
MKPLLIIVHNSNGSCYEPLLITLDYQQRYTNNGSKIVYDGSYEPL